MHPTRNNEPPSFHPKTLVIPIYFVVLTMTHTTSSLTQDVLWMLKYPHTHFHFLILQKEIEVYYTFELFICLIVGFIFETRSHVAYAFLEPTL